MDQTEPTLEIVNDSAAAKDIRKTLGVLKHQCIGTRLAYVEEGENGYTIYNLLVGNKHPERHGTQTRLAHLKLTPSQNGHGWDFAVADSGWES